MNVPSLGSYFTLKEKAELKLQVHTARGLTPYFRYADVNIHKDCMMWENIGIKRELMGGKLWHSKPNIPTMGRPV